MSKHHLKQIVAHSWAGFLFWTGAWRVVNRLAPRRLLILAGHCVDDPEVNGDLPRHLRIQPSHLERLLRGLSRHFPAQTVGAGLAALSDPQGPRGSVALSMDDGYRDNLTVLPGVLAQTGAGCTVYLESRVLSEGRTNWGHEFFWILRGGGDSPQEFARAWVQGDDSSEAGAKLKELLGRDHANEYHIKKVLKYQADPLQRDAFVGQRFEELGGNRGTLAQRIHLDAEGVRAMLRSGQNGAVIEAGGHTRTHESLARLNLEDQEREICGGQQELEALFPGACGATFAYPYGRDWDWNADSQKAVKKAGYSAALTTMPGVATEKTDLYALPRCMIDDSTSLAMLVAQAAGGFLLFKRP